MTNPSVNDDIFYAISSGDIGLVQALLASGISPDVENNKGERALTVAARANLPKMVSVLLKAGAKPSMADFEEESPLVTAVVAGNLEVVQTILQFDGVARKDRQVAMMKAIKLGRPLQMIELLLRLPDDFQIEWSESGIDLLGWAVQEGHIPAAKLLLARGILLTKPRSNWTSALHIAAAKGFLELVQIMVEAGADLTARNGKGLTPLMVACYNKQRVVAAYLTEQMRRKDLDIHDSRQLTAVHYAIMMAKDINMVRLLLDRGADPNLCPPNSLSALYAAICANCPDIAGCLLDAWARPANDGEIREIWYITITRDFRGLISRLIDNEVDPNITIVHGYTPLHLAVQQNRSDAVEELLKGGVNPNCVIDVFQLSPLHMASSQGLGQITGQLLENGADVNARACDGATPLLHAARSLREDIVKILLHSGGNPDLGDAYGLTVYNFAKGNAAIEKLIKESSDLLKTSSERVVEDTPSPPLLPQNFQAMYYAAFDGVGKLSLTDDELYLEVYKDWTKTVFEMTLLLSVCTKTETLLRPLYLAYADRWYSLFKEKLSLLCRWCQGSTSDEIYQCESCIAVTICGRCANRYSRGDAFEGCQGHHLWRIPLGLHQGNGQIVSSHQTIQHSTEILSDTPGEASTTNPRPAPSGETPIISRARLIEFNKQDEIPIEATQWIELKKWESIAELDTAIENKESQLRHLDECDTTDVESYWTYSLWLFQRYMMDPKPDALIKLTAAAAITKLLVQKTTAEKREIYYLTARVKAFTFMRMPTTPTSCAEALQEVREGIRACPPHTVERQILVSIFVVVISTLLETKPQDVPFLEDCLAFTKEALANVQPRDTSECPEGLVATSCELTLASLFALRHRQSHARSDLENAIKHKKNALMRPDAEEGNVDVDGLVELSDLLDELYEETGAKQSLDEAIFSLRRICNLATVSLADMIHAKNNCAYYLRKRYLLTANLSDLSDALKLAQETLRLFEDKRIKGSLAHAAALTNIANILDHRYDRLKDRADLESSMTYEREALAVTGISPSERAVKLSNLAQRYKMRYEQYGVLEDVELGISLAKEALCIPKIGREAQQLTINSLCNLLNLRADRFESSPEDYKRIVRLRKIAVGLSSLASCAINFHNLAVALTKRYYKFSDEKDLHDSIRYGFKALRCSSLFDCNRSMYLSSLAARFQFLVNISKRASDYDIAIGLFEAALACPLKSELAYLGLATSLQLRWSEAGTLNDKDLYSALKALEFGLAQSTAPVKIRILYGVCAAKLALQLDDADRAVALSKEVIGFLPTAHYPLTDRSDIEYTLKSLRGFDTVAAAALLKAGYPPARAIESNEASRGVIAHLTLSARAESGVSSTDRLDNTTLTAQTFDPTAPDPVEISRGVIIIDFAISDSKCFAIILRDGRIRHMGLPDLQLKHVQEAGKDIAGPNRISSPRAGNAQERNRRLSRLLLWLWRAVVKPLFSAEALLRQKEDTSPLPHVCWISSGLMGLMPFHAAGDDNLGSMENTMDHVVSSYVPSLRILQHARARQRQLRQLEQPRTLFIGAAKVVGHDDLSASVSADRQVIHQHYPNTDVLLSPSAEEALANMQLANICHCTCHGEMDPKDPSNGRLILGSDPPDFLTIKTLSSHSLANMHLIYLAACSTAENGAEELLTEVVHLASAFQLVGVPHVIATLWPSLATSSSPVVKRFYSHFAHLKDSGLHTIGFGLALHRSVAELRRDWRNDPLAWAPFVHFGPDCQ
ncbi:hypothetical protein CNMCM7691_008779 [Aspergillus felis]|uniref:CHAT domain-containing protein n=1 Tax=Aspergillus felis TaxID=1287682 RepID=A0A8H6V978_9EURO|nr:hypothetical protein CNMCM7691_008779 [Aspergillus felis]